MSESLWGKQGATFSHKNACKEFGLTEDEVIEAMKVGKLQYRQNDAHGNPYFRLLRIEVKALALELHGGKGAEEQEIKHKWARGGGSGHANYLKRLNFSPQVWRF